MKGEVLIFVSRVLCYGSNLLFANKLAEAFEEMGYSVEICELDFSQDISVVLEQYVGKNYVAIIDFNSTLPRLEVDEKERYLDMLNGPFFNYILDHPLYHHPVLDIEIKNYNVICVDYNHQKYIEKYYKGIKNVLMLPLAPIISVNPKSYEKKLNEVIFLGTYTPSRKVDEQIANLDIKSREFIEEIIDNIYYDSKISFEDAMQSVLYSKGIEMNCKEFKNNANKAYLADMYIRALRREKVIGKLVNNNTKISVYGVGWNDFFDSSSENLIIKKDVDYSLMPEIISNAKVVLNVMPEFKNGVHDRVLNTMINQSVSLTDENEYINRNFVNNQELMTYSLDRLEELPEMVTRVLGDNVLMDNIVTNGYNRVIKDFTWKNNAEKILDCVKKNNEN